jgi:hypothetical protein
MKPRTDHEPKASAKDGCGPPADLSLVLDEIVARFAILKAELRDYVASEVRNLARVARRFAVNAVLGLSAAFGVVAFVVTCVVFCLSGLAGWLGEATGRPWLGSLLAGLVGLGLCVGVLLAARSKLKGPAPDKQGESTCDHHDS